MAEIRVSSGNEQQVFQGDTRSHKLRGVARHIVQDSFLRPNRGIPFVRGNIISPRNGPDQTD